MFVLLELFFELHVLASLGQYTQLNVLLDCILEAHLVTALEEWDRSLLVQHFSKPLYILAETLVVDAFVLHELEDVEQSDVVAVDEWENQRLDEINLAFSGGPEQYKVARAVLFFLHHYSLINQKVY